MMGAGCCGANALSQPCGKSYRENVEALTVEALKRHPVMLSEAKHLGFSFQRCRNQTSEILRFAQNDTVLNALTVQPFDAYTNP